MSNEEKAMEERRTRGFGDLPDDILIERGEVQSRELYRPSTPNIAVDVKSMADIPPQNIGKNPPVYPLKVTSTFDTLPINAQALLNTGIGSGAMTKTLDPQNITVWTSRASAADNSWNAIAWSPELGLFAAVSDTGVGNRVMTSPDGINWTSRVSAANNNWRSIAWSPELGLFAAVASSGVGNRVMTSPDGVNWTSRASAADNSWSDIAWSPELGLFAAVGYSAGVINQVMTSPDGINWTSRVSAADNSWYGIAWSPKLGLFAAVSDTGTGNRVMTSPDGVNWTSRVSATNNNWYRIAWSPELGLFAAVSYTGMGNRVMTSPDGINWTSQASAANNDWYGITWSPELRLFAAVAITGVGNRVMTSPDGTNWTSRASAADNGWDGIAWSPELGLFAAVATSGVGNRVMTSSVSTNYYLNYLTQNYTVPESYIAVVKKIRVDMNNIVIGVGNYTLSLLINNSVIPNFNSIPFKSLIGEFIDTHIILSPNSIFTIKVNVGGVVLPNAKAALSGALLVSRGYPTNYEIGSE